MLIPSHIIRARLARSCLLSDFLRDFQLSGTNFNTLLVQSLLMPLPLASQIWCLFSNPIFIVYHFKNPSNVVKTRLLCQPIVWKVIYIQRFVPNTIGKIELLTARVFGRTENFCNLVFYFHVFMGKYKIWFSALFSIKKLCNIMASPFFFKTRTKAKNPEYKGWSTL